MMLFIVGVIEMVIISTWTKVVVETKVLVSGFITVLNVLIWYYVLNKIVSDLSNWRLIVFYAIGCAIGTMISTAYFSWRENKKSDSSSDGSDVLERTQA